MVAELATTTQGWAAGKIEITALTTAVVGTTLGPVTLLIQQVLARFHLTSLNALIKFHNHQVLLKQLMLLPMLQTLLLKLQMLQLLLLKKHAMLQMLQQLLLKSLLLRLPH